MTKSPASEGRVADFTEDAPDMPDLRKDAWPPRISGSHRCDGPPVTDEHQSMRWKENGDCSTRGRVPQPHRRAVAARDSIVGQSPCDMWQADAPWLRRCEPTARAAPASLGPAGARAGSARSKL